MEASSNKTRVFAKIFAAAIWWTCSHLDCSLADLRPSLGYVSRVSGGQGWNDWERSLVAIQPPTGAAATDQPTNISCILSSI